MEDSPGQRIPAEAAIDRPGIERAVVAVPRRTTAAWTTALVLVPLALSAWVYLPVTHVYFWADDFLNLIDLVARDRLDFLLRPFNGHNLLVWRLVCLIAYGLFGIRAGPHYCLILATHLLNVALLFVVVRSLTGSALLACLGATLWGTSPLAAAAIGWYSVYGQVLAAFLLLAVLTHVTYRSAAAGPPSGHAAWIWSACMLLASLCFGVGIGMAMVFPVVLFLLRPDAWTRRVQVVSFALPLVTLVLYFGLRRLYAYIAPMSALEVWQMLFARASLGGAPAVLGQLLGFSVATSVRGFAMAPGTYPDAASVVAIAAFASGVVLVLASGKPDLRRAALAMGILALGIYGVIAVGRASHYVMFNQAPARIAAQPHFHYAGTIPIVVLLCLMIEQVARLSHRAASVRALALGAGIIVGILGFARSGFVIEDHRAARNYVATTLAEIGAAVAARPPGTTVYLDNGVLPVSVRGVMLTHAVLPGRAALFVLVAPSGVLDGRRVRFSEPDPNVFLSYQDRAPKLGALLVPPWEVPPPGPAVAPER
jgi:hypothetical protein